jgi:hypothetical protein
MTWLEKSAAALAIAVCTAALIGCGDSTSPGSATLSDPQGLSSDVQSLGTPFQASAFQSMSALSAGSTPLARTTGLLAALSPIRPASQPQGMSAKPALAVRALRPSFATAPTGPGSLIPATYWGHVFVWDATTSQYIDGAATGGPATGVRFTLYALNPLTGQPATPLNPIGWADLTDESTNTQFKLGVLVADGTTTYADYVVSATTTASSLLADATGYITDGTHRLDFSNSASVTASQVGLDYSLALNQPAVSAHLVATLAVGSTTSVLSATFGVTRGSETVVLNGTLTATQTQSGFTAAAQFVITVNGGQFATITGTAQSGSSASFTYVGPGRALTQAERDAVDRMFEAPGTLSTTVDGVFAPAEHLLGTSASLTVAG